MLPRTNCIVWSFCEKNKTKANTFGFIMPSVSVYLGCWRHLGIIAKRNSDSPLSDFSCLQRFISWYGLENKEKNSFKRHDKQKTIQGLYCVCECQKLQYFWLRIGSFRNITTAAGGNGKSDSLLSLMINNFCRCWMWAHLIPWVGVYLSDLM